MATYDNDTLNKIPPMLQPGEKEYILVVQDETVFHTNEYCRQSWLTQDQQLIWKKGGGRVIHVSDFEVTHENSIGIFVFDPLHTRALQTMHLTLIA